MDSAKLDVVFFNSSEIDTTAKKPSRYIEKYKALQKNIKAALNVF